MATPPGPQARRTTEYCCTAQVLPRPTVRLPEAWPAPPWPAPHCGAARLQESTLTQLELDLGFLVPRGTGQQHTYQEHHTRDTRDEDDEEDAWNRMKSMRGTG